VEDHGGIVPDDLEALTALPGVGPYTARAVLVYAFDRPIAALDTNVRRVLERALGPLPAAPKALQSTADGFVPEAAPAAWSHALMDLGATTCVARSPRCDTCPIRDWCVARSSGTDPWQQRRPRTHAAFPSTSRWLRGRILDRLRDEPDGAWVVFGPPIGTHSGVAVRAELTRMSSEGLLELSQSTNQARLVSSL